MKNILCIILSFSFTFLFAEDPEKLYLEVKNETCLKDDGEIKASIASGTLPMTFTWSNGETATVNKYTHTIIGLNAGTYTCEVQDAHGCRAVDDATVILLLDSIPPVAYCKDITVPLDSSGKASITATEIDGGSTDECIIDTMTVDPTDFSCYDIGSNQVTLTVTDEEGNTGTCTATVTVEDDIGPIAKCQDFTVSLDSNGVATISAEDIDNGSTDNCRIDSMSVSPKAFGCSDLGENQVTLTVTDEAGNSSNCTATVTVEDVIKPVAKCQDITVSLDGSGVATISASDVNGGSTDNCGIKSISVSPTAFGCSDLGSNQVTLTVTDDSGNTSNCTATVTVEGDCCDGVVYDASTEQCCEETDENPGVQPIDVECNPPSGSGNGDSTSMSRIQSSVEADEIYYQFLSIKVFPNPVKDVINLHVKSPISEVVQIEIYNIQGNRVYETTSYILKGDYSRQIQLPENTPSGTYILNVKVGEYTDSEKIILLKQ